MAHFAELDKDKKVIRVVVINNNDITIDGVESEAKGIEFCKSLLTGEWIQTSYNAKSRGKYAAIGDFYDSVKDEFIAQELFIDAD
jgi:hypothetical protein